MPHHYFHITTEMRVHSHSLSPYHLLLLFLQHNQFSSHHFCNLAPQKLNSILSKHPLSSTRVDSIISLNYAPSSTCDRRSRKNGRNNSQARLAVIPCRCTNPIFFNWEACFALQSTGLNCLTTWVKNSNKSG